MAISESEALLIDKYLEGSLNEAERQDFERLRNSSPEFVESLEVQQVIAAGVKAVEKDLLRRQLMDMVKEDEQQRTVVDENPKVKVIQFNPRIYGLAGAAAVVLLALLFLPKLSTDHQHHESVFLTYYEPLPVVAESRSGSKEKNKGLALYDAGQYKAAIPLLQATLSRDTTYSTAVYLGVSYLEIKDDDKAIQHFQLAMDFSPDVFVRQNAEWYACLAFVRNGEEKKARDLLEKIIKEKGIYAERASPLRQAIE